MWTDRRIDVTKVTVAIPDFAGATEMVGTDRAGFDHRGPTAYVTIETFKENHSEILDIKCMKV